MDCLQRGERIGGSSFVHDNALQLSIVAILFLVAVAPTLIVDMPAIIDYPNHLARMHILLTNGTPDANPFYQVEWRLYPNLAMDLLVPQFARFMRLEVATKFFLILSQLLVVTGAMALEYQIKGRIILSGLVSLIMLFCLPFEGALLNFEFGMGACLWGLAFWFAFAHRTWLVRFAVHSMFVLVLFLSHFFALGVYGFTLGICELHRLLSKNLQPRDFALTFTLLALPAIILLTIMVISGGAIGGGKIEWDFATKFVLIFHFMSVYSTTHSALIVLALAIMLLFLVRGQFISLIPAGRWLAIGFLALSLGLPFWLFGTALGDVRAIIAAFLVVPAFINFSCERRRVRLAFGAAAIVIFLVNVAHVTREWLFYDPHYAAMKTSFRLIEPRSRVLVAHNGTEDGLISVPGHALICGPTLAVMGANSLVPLLFAIPGMNPISLRPEFKKSQIARSHDYHPVSITTLQTAAENFKTQHPEYLRDWPANYDYLYVIGPRMSNSMPNLLEQIADREYFSIYRIRK